jgi:hypothetical protein
MIAANAALGLEVSNDRLDSGTPAQLATTRPAMMTRHPIAQGALNGIPHRTKLSSLPPFPAKNRSLHSPRFARKHNGSALLHGHEGIFVDSF